MTLPGVGLPQFIEHREVVHALSEYIPKFADVYTAPLEGTFVDVEIAAKVTSVKAIEIVTNAATAVVIDNLSFAVIVPPEQSS